MFCGCFNEASNHFMNVSTKFKGSSIKKEKCYMVDSKKFQISFKRVSTKFQGYFQIVVSRVFQGRLKGVSREISVSFKGI